MNKTIILFLVFSCSFPWLSFAQLDYKQIINKKDDILLKSNRNTSDLIDEVQLNNQELIDKFETKRAVLIIHKEDTKELEFWRKKADLITEKTTTIINRILEEMNTIAQLADNSQNNYIQRSKNSRTTQSLSPLLKINNLTNRTVPMKRIVGDDIYNPNPEGINIEKELSMFKNDVFDILTNYSYKEKNYFYTRQVTDEDFEQSLAHVNPSDKYYLQQINDIIYLGKVTYIIDDQTDETVIISWLTDNFIYSSVLETAVIINQIVLKLKLMENKALSLLLDKIEAPYFSYNKLSPYAVATGEPYQNNLSLKVIIAAEDTTKSYEYRYSLDKNKPKEEWKMGKGTLTIQKDILNNHKIIYGETKIITRGRDTWIPWTYSLEKEQ